MDIETAIVTLRDFAIKTLNEEKATDEQRLVTEAAFVVAESTVRYLGRIAIALEKIAEK